VIDFIEYYKNRGHVFGECMSKPDTDLMYINIPKNASSWTKPNLRDWGWEFYNYHTDKLHNKHALVILRDPVERWLSGIAEYMTLYHVNVDPTPWLDLIFERIAFDDHTENQVLFLQDININNCTFFLCNQDFKNNFSDFLNKNNMPNSYDRYEYQHVSAQSPERTRFKNIFAQALENSKYKQQLEWYFEKDYKLIRSVQFYAR
jgi:hypothetical protein